MRELPLLSRALLAQLERFRLRFGKLSGALVAGERPALALGSGIEFSESRPYMPGDDLRYLDWNAYGRLDALFSKQFETFGELTLNLLIDCSPSMDFGALDAPLTARRSPGAPGHKRGFALKLAAALGFVALSAHDAVRVLVFPDVPERPPRFAGRARVTRLLDHLAALTTRVPRPHDLRNLAEQLAEPRHQHWLVVLSDVQDADAWFRVLMAAKLKRMNVALFHLVAPGERRPPLSGSVELLPPAGRARALRADVTPKLLARYREGLDRHLRRVRAFCNQKGIGYVLLETGTPFGTPLWSRLRAHGILG